ncbi:corA-like mg2+ transporter protein domain-containing protein [Ophiocordyceps camponoti-floridani]|uniref:CorA-like mg2+ transporter protein domain-containing protein n=1 Tax=Ophiocordyceps camponoti-floridani TaxID=2030778 RepID=A0A8H4VAL2_9HYPO|nr:corA-like mg2+ transporter protein domain-containing protein [Ophiocordyceps camponoti-floridani]
MFAEMERNRQIALVDEATQRLGQRVCEIGSETALDSEPEHDHQKGAPRQSAMDLWMDTSHLRDSLCAFKRQIENMVEHMDELDATLFRDEPRLVMSVEDTERNLSLRNSAVRIRSRLRELVDEYDEHIRRCTTLTDGMNLATQLEWNNLGRRDAVNIQNISKSNLQVVEHAAKDGRLMKSIAIITVVFLPATFLATFFSMTFFDWKGPGGATASPYLWIYVLLAAVLSLMTFGAWFAYAVKHDGVVKSAV